MKTSFKVHAYHISVSYLMTAFNSDDIVIVCFTNIYYYFFYSPLAESRRLEDIISK